MPPTTPPLSRKILLDWAGPNIMRDAETLYKKGLVESAEYEHPLLKGGIRWGNRLLKTELLILGDRTAENHCPCRDNTERGIICAHVTALGISIVERLSDPRRAEKYQEEMRQAERLARYDESAYIKRAKQDTAGAVSMDVHLTLPANWPEQCAEGRIDLRAEAELPGELRVGLGELNRAHPYLLSRHDEALLFVLEDVSEGPCRTEIQVGMADFVNLLRLTRGRQVEVIDGAPIEIHDIPMESQIHVDLDRENGELILLLETALPFGEPGTFPVYAVDGRRGGWVYAAQHFWPLADVLPEPLRGLYADPVAISRDAVPAFLKKELPFLETQLTVVTKISPELFSMQPAKPVFILQVKGSPASLSATLYADYGVAQLIAGKNDAAGDFSIPDNNDLMSYWVRNMSAELAAVKILAAVGMVGELGDQLSPVVGVREVLNFLGRYLPSLRRRGWKIQLEGTVAPFMDELEYATPVVQIRNGGEGGWFEVDFDFDSGGSSLRETDIQKAILKGDSYCESNGKVVLFDSEAVNWMQDLFGDVASDTAHGGDARLRIDKIHAAYVKNSLDALDGVDVEATPDWRNQATSMSGDLAEAPVTLPPGLADILRPYQSKGVRWLRFLEVNRFGGILADEMGLGKTLQTLTWLTLNRADPSIDGQPSLIVCPTSLVDNWRDEAAKFFPAMKVLTVSGPGRKEALARLHEADLVVTSYALLRRDIEQYLETNFAALILDEAQHIKNRSTRNAVAAKQLRGHHRVVLTGTPIENSVSDLWSIMDFLMPSYLGGHEAFRADYETPISRGGRDAEYAQSKLRRKLAPFLLRRLKIEVAKDLPPKIEKTQFCTLSPDQQAVYKEYLDQSRRKIADMVAKKGFDQSRMEIFKVLLRLRQVCCHLELLKLKDLDPKQPSAKLDLFFELVDEALDGGHRILVFSQFTSMLHILQREIHARGLTNCYLDGSTKDRLKVVREFNTQPEIPIFLISLKAGGTGLTLTGADMVIHFDPWWNPAVEDQATDRAHRIGQKRTVYGIKLITRNTVEEKVLEMQQRKRAVINATLEQPDGDMAKLLTWDDVQELLTF